MLRYSESFEFIKKVVENSSNTVCGMLLSTVAKIVVLARVTDFFLGARSALNACIATCAPQKEVVMVVLEAPSSRSASKSL